MNRIIPGYTFSSLLILCLFFQCFRSKASEYEIDNTRRRDSVINLLHKMVETHPDSALCIIEKEMTTAKQYQDDILMGFLYLRKGGIFRKVDPDKATKYYFKAKQIFENIQHEKGLAAVLNNIGTYTNLPARERLSYLYKALSLNKKRRDTNYIMFNHINISGIYINELRDWDSAEAHLAQSHELSKKLNFQSVVAVSIMGRACIQQMHYQDTIKAIKQFRKALEIIHESEKGNILTLKHNLFILYLQTGQVDSAFYYLDLIKDHYNSSPKLQSKGYHELSEYYLGIGDVKSGLLYDHKSDSVREYLNSHNNENLLRFLEIEHEAKLSEETVARLHAEVEKGQTTRIFLSILMGVIILFSISLFYQQYQKNKKRRENILEKKRRAEAEKRLIQAELENSELKSKQLHEQLRYTNHELASFAAGTIQNKEVLTDLKDNLEKISRTQEMSSIKDNLKDLRIRLTQMLSKDDDNRRKLIDKAEDINASLVYSLKSKYPDLTYKDLNLLVLLLLKFNSKDIASIYNIAERSVVKRRYRLRKKLDVGKYESFEGFIERVLPDIDFTVAD